MRNEKKSWRKRQEEVSGLKRGGKRQNRVKESGRYNKRKKANVGEIVRAIRSLNTALDAVPPVKAHIYLSNFYQLNGYSPESPIGGT